MINGLALQEAEPVKSTGFISDLFSLTLSVAALFSLRRFTSNDLQNSIIEVGEDM